MSKEFAEVVIEKVYGTPVPHAAVRRAAEVFNKLCQNNATLDDDSNVRLFMDVGDIRMAWLALVMLNEMTIGQKEDK